MSINHVILKHKTKSNLQFKLKVKNDGKVFVETGHALSLVEGWKMRSQSLSKGAGIFQKSIIFYNHKIPNLGKKTCHWYVSTEDFRNY